MRSDGASATAFAPRPRPRGLGTYSMGFTGSFPLIPFPSSHPMPRSIASLEGAGRGEGRARVGAGAMYHTTTTTTTTGGRAATRADNAAAPSLAAKTAPEALDRHRLIVVERRLVGKLCGGGEAAGGSGGGGWRGGGGACRHCCGYSSWRAAAPGSAARQSGATGEGRDLAAPSMSSLSIFASSSSRDIALRSIARSTKDFSRGAARRARARRRSQRPHWGTPGRVHKQAEQVRSAAARSKRRATQLRAAKRSEEEPQSARACRACPLVLWLRVWLRSFVEAIRYVFTLDSCVQFPSNEAVSASTNLSARRLRHEAGHLRRGGQTGR